MSYLTNIRICNSHPPCALRQLVCNGACVCTVDGVPVIEHAKQGFCPKNYFSSPPEPARPAPVFDGSKLWALIHRRPYTVASADKELEWLMAIAAQLPCGSCKQGWVQAVESMPPEVLTGPQWRDDYFAWTVATHNAVNVKPTLNKAVMSLDAARQRWSATDGQTTTDSETSICAR